MLGKEGGGGGILVWSLLSPAMRGDHAVWYSNRGIDAINWQPLGPQLMKFMSGAWTIKYTSWLRGKTKEVEGDFIVTRKKERLSLPPAVPFFACKGTIGFHQWGQTSTGQKNDRSVSSDETPAFYGVLRLPGKSVAGSKKMAVLTSLSQLQYWLVMHKSVNLLSPISEVANCFW